MTDTRILIVEDNQVNAMILRAMLRKHGFDPLVANDGLEGIAQAEQHRPQLILMDLQMPRLDGFGAAERILATSGGQPPIILAVSANSEDEVREACLAAGFAGMLQKPIMLEDLISAVERHLAAP